MKYRCLRVFLYILSERAPFKYTTQQCLRKGPYSQQHDLLQRFTHNLISHIDRNTGKKLNRNKYFFQYVLIYHCSEKAACTSRMVDMFIQYVHHGLNDTYNMLLNMINRCQFMFIKTTTVNVIQCMYHARPPSVRPHVRLPFIQDWKQ